MAESFLARLYALRALTVFIAMVLLLAGLASGAWAQDPDQDLGAEASQVEPAGAARAGDLRLHQERISQEIDGWLNVLVDDEGRVLRNLSDGLVWRLEISSQARPDPQDYIFSIRPAALPLSQQPCGAGELCPAGYAVAASSRLVSLEPLREVKSGAGKAHYRQAAKIVLPFDLSWVEFYDDFQIAVAEACRMAFTEAIAAGGKVEDLHSGYLDPQLTFPLKAAVFSEGRSAETEVAVHLRCWGRGFTR